MVYLNYFSDSSEANGQEVLIPNVSYVKDMGTVYSADDGTLEETRVISTDGDDLKSLHINEFYGNEVDGSHCRVGDVLYKTSANTYYTAVYNTRMGDTPVAVCVIPDKFLPDGYARFISLHDVGFDNDGNVCNKDNANVNFGPSGVYVEDTNNLVDFPVISYEYRFNPEKHGEMTPDDLIPLSNNILETYATYVYLCCDDMSFVDRSLDDDVVFKPRMNPNDVGGYYKKTQVSHSYTADEPYKIAVTLSPYVKTENKGHAVFNNTIQTLYYPSNETQEEIDLYNIFYTECGLYNTTMMFGNSYEPSDKSQYKYAADDWYPAAYAAFKYEGDCPGTITQWYVPSPLEFACMVARLSVIKKTMNAIDPNNTFMDGHPYVTCQQAGKNGCVILQDAQLAVYGRSNVSYRLRPMIRMKFGK